MFEWFAQQEGLDLKKVQTKNQTTPGLSTMAQTGRTDATQLWEPSYTTLTAGNSKINTIDLDEAAWEKKFGTDEIPYLGLAATTKWAKGHPDEVQSLYDTYEEAADWALKNPDEAAKIIAEKIPGGDPDVVVDLLENNDEHLRMNVAPAADLSKGIRAVFKSGVETKYLTKQPPKSIIYDDLK